MLHYQQLHSDAPNAIIILHGLFGNGDNWKSLARWLPEQRVILPDLPGHGRSALRGHWRHESAAQQVLQLADHLGLHQFALLGHSLGGKVAMSLAQQAPERIRQLVIADIAPKAYPPHHQQIFQALSAINTDTLTNRRDAEQQLEQGGVTMKAVRQFLVKSLANDGERYHWLLDIANLSSSQTQVSAAPLLTQPFAGPGRFICGELSDYVTLADQELIAHWFPNTDTQRLAQTGHWLHVEQPQRFMRLVRESLGLPLDHN